MLTIFIICYFIQRLWWRKNLSFRCLSVFFPVFYTRASITNPNPNSNHTHTYHLQQKMLLLYAKIGKMWNVSVCIISFVCICITNDANAGKHFAQQTKRMITNQKYCTNKNPFHHRVCALAIVQSQNRLAWETSFVKKSG